MLNRLEHGSEYMTSQLNVLPLADFRHDIDVGMPLENHIHIVNRIRTPLYIYYYKSIFHGT